MIGFSGDWLNAIFASPTSRENGREPDLESFRFEELTVEVRGCK
jgi:hypothetical protein